MHRYWGEILLGFGLLFIGIETMTGAMKPLRESPVFAELMLTLSNKWYYGLLVGAGVTAIVQSSSATTGIVQGLARDGLIPLGLALPVLLGNNIGTTITAMLSSIGTSVNARRAAMSHLFFNVVGALIFLPVLPWFIQVVRLTSPSITRQIANAHTVFNVSNTLILLPLSGVLAYVVTQLVPEDPGEKAVSPAGQPSAGHA